MQTALLVKQLRSEFADAPVAQLSTGEKQRLSLVRALLPNPPVLLLDEPTGPLDEESVTQVEALLQERMAAGTSILLVTHDARQAERLGVQRYRMMAGHMERRHDPDPVDTHRHLYSRHFDSP